MFWVTVPRNMGGGRGMPCSPELLPSHFCLSKLHSCAENVARCVMELSFVKQHGDILDFQLLQRSKVKPQPGDDLEASKREKLSLLRLVANGKWVELRAESGPRAKLSLREVSLTFPFPTSRAPLELPWVIYSHAQPSVLPGIRENIQTLISLSAI